MPCLPTYRASFTDLSCLVYRPIVSCLPTYRALAGFADLSLRRVTLNVGGVLDRKLIFWASRIEEGNCISCSNVRTTCLCVCNISRVSNSLIVIKTKRKKTLFAYFLWLFHNESNILFSSVVFLLWENKTKRQHIMINPALICLNSQHNMCPYLYIDGFF